ncbi:Transcription factor [Komagataella phaffii CBS 7435]|uniref:Transcription factor n=2 Tax=Komagataella phaffii TaxID=460519 RepID=C4QY81_KOMPG|nr:Hypothetical protein PAS_chr1-4_0361 [Komagataella phaffii GS115]AOA61243.1 GQ67_01807T0 [Komagataella phaffii]CAH2447025.1 Transcription factor [Komagataella phaffii CBS 7435]AOA66273.1 GQ68_01822T0 [Komagataella phaffii GS115]CAY68204.1 Hypothetical protein PAS_chr1-4_0361 [Komagataella phaffii GS115]CCA37276.1 Transcription factor [Komagataella phaffii CBS 7435]
MSLIPEKKLFDDKLLIKPWLQSQLIVKGINIVIERSDDSKIVFKCKNSGVCGTDEDHVHFAIKQRKRANRVKGLSVSEKEDNERFISSEKKKLKDLRKKHNCPFRIRANFSLRSKKWSIVVVNDEHNHPLYPIIDAKEIGRRNSEKDIGHHHLPQHTDDRDDFQQTQQQQQQQQHHQNTSSSSSSTSPTPFDKPYQSYLALPSISKEASNISSPLNNNNTSNNNNNSTMANNTNTADLNISNIQRINNLQLELNNLLIQLNNSNYSLLNSSTKLSHKEDIYLKLISILKDSLMQESLNYSYTVSTSPGVGSGATPTNQNNILLPSLQPIRSTSNQSYNSSSAPQNHIFSNYIAGTHDNAFMKF